MTPFYAQESRKSWRARVSGARLAVREGIPTNSQNLYYRSLELLLRGAGFSNTLLHELRHTCATIRFMKGQHPKVVQELLGHKSIAITLDIYSHVIPGMGGDDPMEDALS